ncbi:MAG: RecQ family ATP-dependent DNA helicase [Prevotellaceae bacterium]|nr:RecQ family ATP-dependent DNA helicase [Prevotellaceae bacterium]
MLETYLDILSQYFGYTAFRALQGDIIESVGAGRDTLGLMPTGGGKSLTFQVPALAQSGVCVVVTPLIALMNDQVENLQNRGIAAAAIHSAMPAKEIARVLDNAVLAAYKFLYVSPERLDTELFKTKIAQTEVSILAIDEAHCISQWGYDFRPSYLKIAEIRTLLPNVPVLALTATATPEVVDDIQEKLLFRPKNVFRKSFHRSNLAYVVRTTENKDEQLLKILKNVQGTSVVYVRNRKKTKEIAEFLCQNGIFSEHFHAGLSAEQKDATQSRWKTDKTRVIVATNAFGMGIDKPDVRTVVHIDLPDSLEAYFQEAGRAGRDEKKAFAVLLYNNADATKLKKRIADSFPQKEYVAKVYEALGNYYQIGVGSGLEHTFPFNLNELCQNFHLNILQTFNALKILQQAGYLELTDEQDSKSSVVFTVNKDELYKIRTTEQQEKLIHVLLRSYTGLFTDPAYINENMIAARLGCTYDEVYKELIGLSKEKVIQYIPRKKTPFITYMLERQDIKHLNLTKEVYEERRNRYEKRVGTVLKYAQEGNICRSKMLLAYFGETDLHNCGQCDICLKHKALELQKGEFEKIRIEIEKQLTIAPHSVQNLVKKIGQQEPKVLQVIRFLLDNEMITQNEMMQLKLTSL